MHSAADRNAELPVYGRDPFLAFRHFIAAELHEPYSCPLNAGEAMRALFHQVRFASNSLVAISALFLTLATARLVRCRPWRGSMLETLGRRINKFPRWQFWPDMLRSAVMPG